MEIVLPTSPSCLDLTISVPGFTSSDLDINQVPSGTGAEEDWTTGSMEEEEGEEESGSGGPLRKKLRLSIEQSRLLEESFRQTHTLNPKQKEALALQLKLRPRQVEVWFQNRRARTKLKQTEMECEYLKKWFGLLTEQNRELQREVEELRAMKLSPPPVISPHSCEPLPASTLSMCPRCEHCPRSWTISPSSPTPLACFSLKFPCTTPGNNRPLVSKRFDSVIP